MRSFECLMTDDRSSVPQLSWLLVSDVERARELARQDLLNDAHHQAVELREKGEVVFSATRADLLPKPAESRAAPERRSFRRERR